MGVMEPADCLKVLTRSAFESYPQTIESDPPPARVCDIFHCVTVGRRDVRWPKADIRRPQGSMSAIGVNVLQNSH